MSLKTPAIATSMTRTELHTSIAEAIGQAEVQPAAEPVLFNGAPLDRTRDDYVNAPREVGYGNWKKEAAQNYRPFIQATYEASRNPSLSEAERADKKKQVGIATSILKWTHTFDLSTNHNPLPGSGPGADDRTLEERYTYVQDAYDLKR